MNQNSPECRPCLRTLSFLRRSLLVIALLSSPALFAQLTISQTYSVPHSVDGGSLPIFFDLSTQLLQTDATISHTRLSIDFSKAAALFDDPPFYSDIGLILRKLDNTFSVISTVTLLAIGGFNDGIASSFFNGVITFDDDASLAVNSDPDQPTSGLFRATEPLSLLNGIYSPYWELRLVDAVSESPLLFHSATLTTTVFAAVPEPASVSLVGACLLGWVVFRRRNSTTI